MESQTSPGKSGKATDKTRNSGAKNVSLYLITEGKFCNCYYFISHTKLLKLLILSVCGTRVIYEPSYGQAQRRVSRAQHSPQCSPFPANSVLSVLHFPALSLKLTLADSSVNLPVFSCKSLNLEESSPISSAHRIGRHRLNLQLFKNSL